MRLNFKTKAVIVLLGLALIYVYKIEPYWIEVKEQPVYIANLPASFRGFRIVQLSDLHGKLFRDKKIAASIKKLSPDIVVITGDVFDQSEEIPLDYVDNVFNGLTAKSGVYFVFGNNDTYLNKEMVRDELSKLNIKTLINERVQLTRNGQSLDLIGVEDPYTQNADLLRAVQGSGPEPKILLAHTPEIIMDAVKAGIDLVLVGHTHGGQILLPFLPRLITNVSKGYEQFNSGLFRVGGTKMYVNRGLGENGVNMRFFCRPEITVITLH